jgi:NAD(P)-dependent dehydrogenase (short-subunit alcohol dehydrogenase family)
MNDRRDLEGLRALVTGATSGLGKAAAEELGRHGAEIVVHGRDVDRGSTVAGTITAAGGKARFVAAGLTDPAQLDHLAGQAGAVDVLVNNAGFSWFGPTAELDVATFGRLFAVNVRSAYFLVAALAPEDGRQGKRQLAMANTAGADITEVDAPHLSMVSDPVTVTNVILQAVRATSSPRPFA